MSVEPKKPIRRTWKFSIDKSVCVLLILAFAAGVMATGHDGWGWLVFIAILMIL